MNEWILTEDGTLCHHGILGQKWGVRRGTSYPLNPSQHSAAEKKAARKNSAGKVFTQNIKQGKDKPNTSVAEKTVNKAKDINDAGKSIAKNTADAAKAAERMKYKKNAKTMTDAELQSAIKRMELEKRYSDLSTEDYSSGADKAATILQYTGDILAIGASAAAIAATIYNIKKG